MPPGIEAHTDILYQPLTTSALDTDPQWGLYDGSGALLDAGAYYRGPGQAPVGQSLQRPWPAVVAVADSTVLIYGGVIVDHFGHFLLTSLARLWPVLMLPGDRSAIRILFHGAGDPAQWWAVPYIAACFSALGLVPANIVHFPVPTRIPQLVVPRPAFEEHNFVHRAYVALTRTIGAGLTKPSLRRCGPVYMARTRYPRITQGFVNEQELVDRLATLGIAIVYPEDLSFAAHVDLFQTASVVLGPISSTFHPAVFARTCCPLLLLSPNHIVNPNFAMVDQIGGLSAEYFFVDPGRLDDDGAGRVTHRYVIRDVASLAADIVGRLRLC